MKVSARQPRHYGALSHAGAPSCTPFRMGSPSMAQSTQLCVLLLSVQVVTAVPGTWEIMCTHMHTLLVVVVVIIIVIIDCIVFRVNHDRPGAEETDEAST